MSVWHLLSNQVLNGRKDRGSDQRLRDAAWKMREMNELSEWEILWFPCFLLNLSAANNLHVWDMVKHIVITACYLKPAGSLELQLRVVPTSPLFQRCSLLHFWQFWHMESECSIMLHVAFHFTFFIAISKHKSEVIDLLFATNSSASWLSWGKLCIWSTALF